MSRLVRAQSKMMSTKEKDVVEEKKSLSA
jgi:hypothetical protein